MAKSILALELEHLGAELIAEMPSPELRDLIIAKYGKTFSLSQIQKVRKKIIDAAGVSLNLRPTEQGVAWNHY